MEKNVTVIPASRMRIRPVSMKGGKTIRVAAYCRVSTDEEEQLHSFGNQVEYYTNYIKNKPEYELVKVYGDEGISGTSLKKREQFKQMIEDCKAGKIDLVITKSISRFARNTQDCLHYSRLLKDFGIGVFFEKENINTMDSTGELLFTILSSLAQEESRNISENCKWGMRSQFKKGICHLKPEIIMGYKRDEDGKPEIDPDEAKVIKRIYKEFLEGYTAGEIALRLTEDGILSKHGNKKWHASTIEDEIRNEKYIGDSLLQKTIVTDFLSKKVIKNTGQLEQYYVTNSHPAIIDKETWEAAQLEFKRRRQFIKDHEVLRYGDRRCPSPFVGRIFCGKCGSRYCRHDWHLRGYVLWQCKQGSNWKGGKCHSRIITAEILDKAFVLAWNTLVGHREQHMKIWNEMIEHGNALERLRARQMKEITAEGKITKQIPELTRVVLESVIVNDESIEVRFLDGQRKEVRL